MDIHNLEQIKQEFSGFQQEFETGNKEKALEKLLELLDALEEADTSRRAAQIDKDGNVTLSPEIPAGKPAAEKSAEDGTGKSQPLYMSLNHVMEYYIFAYYFQPATEVRCTDIPYGEYYRTYGQLALSMQKYNGAKKAYERAIAWNPVDLDAYLGLAEVYKYQNQREKYLTVTRQAYRYCCTRATMARYYRNMAFYYLSGYEPETARACYQYSNVYYHTENADSELKYISEAIQQETPQTDIRAIQKLFDEKQIEPGPDSQTIGIVYKVGEILLKDGDYKLAKDCYSIVYDITQDAAAEKMLNELEAAISGSEE